MVKRQVLDEARVKKFVMKNQKSMPFKAEEVVRPTSSNDPKTMQLSRILAGLNFLRAPAAARLKLGCF